MQLSCACVWIFLHYYDICTCGGLPRSWSTGGREKQHVYSLLRKILWFCFSASLSILAPLSVFLQSFIMSIIIYYTVRGSVSKLLACTQPIFKQNTREGFHKYEENPAQLCPCQFSSSEHNPVSSVRISVSGCSGLSRLGFTFHACVFCCTRRCSSSTLADILRPSEWDRLVPSGLDLSLIGDMWCVPAGVPQAGLNDTKQCLIRGWKVAVPS